MSGNRHAFRIQNNTDSKIFVSGTFFSKHTEATKLPDETLPFEREIEMANYGFVGATWTEETDAEPFTEPLTQEQFEATLLELNVFALDQNGEKVKIDVGPIASKIINWNLEVSVDDFNFNEYTYKFVINY